MREDITLNANTHRPAHPLVYLFLIIPFGAISGYVTVTIAYLYSKAGISVEEIAALVGATLLPSVLKFLWSPLVDAFLSLKKWYLISSVLTAVGMFALGVLPVKESSIPLLTIIIVFGTVTSSFLGIAVNGLAAHDVPDEMKGRVSGYLQAGNLGGSGLGGGAGLLIAQQVNAIWIPGAILAVCCLLCCIGLFFVKEPHSTIRAEKLGTTLKNLFKDMWDTMKVRLGVLALILCFLPLGTGAASNLWAAVATGWHASANTVALVTGLFSAGITAASCLLGGWVCDRYNRQVAYVVFGLMQAACALGMAYSPHIEIMYITWTSLYAFTLGLSYAAFSAFVFEAIGKGAAGTKFTVYSSLSNAPIWYMTLLDGWAQTKYGSNIMLDVEAACAVIAIVLFMGLLKYANAKPATVSVGRS